MKIHILPEYNIQASTLTANGLFDPAETYSPLVLVTKFL